MRKLLFIPLLLTTLCSTIVGLIVVSLYQRINLFKRAFLIMFAIVAALVISLIVDALFARAEKK